VGAERAPSEPEPQSPDLPGPVHSPDVKPIGVLVAEVTDTEESR